MSSTATPKTLTVKIAATDTAQRIFPAGSVQPKTCVIKFRALSTNAGISYLGDSTVKQSSQNGEGLAAGASTDWRTQQLIATEAAYVSGTANDQISITYFEVK